MTGLLAAAFQGCYFTAVSLTSVSLATLVTIGGSPVIVQVAERFRGRGRGTAGATLLALCGLGLLVGLPSGGPGYAAVLASAGFALLAAAGFATLTLIGASPVPGLDDLTVTGFGFTFGGLVLLPFAAVSGLAFRPGPAAIGLLIALGTGPTAAAYTLYFRGLRGAPAWHGGAARAPRAAHRHAARRAAARRQAEPAGHGGRRPAPRGGRGDRAAGIAGYGRTAPSKLAAYQSSFCGIFSTSSPVCGASMM